MSQDRDDRESAAVAVAPGCPDPAALAAFVSGKLAEGDLVTIADHVSHCETCETTVRALSGGDGWLVGRLRVAVAHDSAGDELACLRMPEAAKALRPPVDDSATAETEQDAGTGGSRSAAERQAAATATWSPPMPATIGRYQVRSELGRGGFGAVYLAHDADLDRPVAIKVPRFDKGVDDQRMQWFLHEARAAARLKHPGIVGVHEVGRQGDGSCYIVMEYIEGQSLSAEMARGKLPRERVVEIVRQVAAAVQYAHKKGLVHRDLKPGNILLDAEGHVKIADFGLAVHEDQQRSRAGELAGTLAYMSPEQVRRDVHRLDGRSDIWALGVILYELLTGRRPFAGTRDELTDEILHRSPKPPRQIDDKIPPELERVCLKCLAKDPDQRYSSAGDVAGELAGSNEKQSTRGWLRSRRLLLAVAALLVAASLSIPFLTRGKARKHPYQVDRVAKLLAPLELMDAPPEELFQGSDPQSRALYDPQRREITMESPSINFVSLGETKSNWYKIRVFISKPSVGGEAGVFLGYQPLPPLNGKRRWKCHTVCVNSVDKEQFAIVRSSYDITENSLGGPSAPGRDLVKVAVPVRVMENAMLEISVRMNRISEVSWQGTVLPKLADTRNAEEIDPPACDGRFGVINSGGGCTMSGGQFVLLREVP